MLFSTIVYGALAHAMAASAATMVVTVAANNKFVFTPNTITAQPGDMVAFNFLSQNHSVASSSANTPCQPEQNAIFSDFQPIADPNARANGNSRGRAKNNRRQAGTQTPMFMVPITDNQPMYIYCSQAQHCQQGMVMVINPPNAGAVQQYTALAAKANNNISPPGSVAGGRVLNNAAGTTPKVVLGGTQGDAAPANKGGKAPVKGVANTPPAAKGGNGGNGGKGGNGGNGGGLLAGLLGGGKNN